MLSPRLFSLLLAGLCLAPARGAPFDEFVAGLYRPWQAERVALSPNGGHVAYTRHERGELAIYIMAVDRTERKFKIAVEDDRPVPFSKEKAPASLRFLAWASPTRLVFAPTSYNNGVRSIAPIFAVNLDGTEPKTLAEDDDFSALNPNISSRRTNLLGFRPGDRSALLVEALGRSTTLFSVDVMTGKKAEHTEEIESARYYYDPSGRVRMLYTLPPYAPTRIFRFKIGGTWDRWVDMNEKWGGPVAKPFVVTVDNYYGERAFPLGFDADPDLLYYASNLGRDTYGIYALNVKTKQRTALALEDPHVDLAMLEPSPTGGPLVLDEFTGKLAGVRARGVAPFTRWVDPELTTLQGELEVKFPQRTVEILQWDETRRRFLLRVTGGIEPGRYHVFQRPEKVLVEVLRSAPWLRNAELHAGTTFAFDPPGGGHLTGHLTFPRKPRLTPTPLLIDFSDGVMGRAQPGFDREAQVLAEMGFIVARVNHRGMSGFGLAHRDAIRTGGDRVPVDDALAVIEWIARHHAIDRKRVATIGRGLGGYLALRALQLEPGVFRCGIAIDAPLAPEAWLQPPLDTRGLGSDSPATFNPSPPPPPPPRPINFIQEAQRAFLYGRSPHLGSVLSSPETLTKPVMLIVNGPPSGTIAQQNDSLRSKLKRQGRPPEFLEADSNEGQHLPKARAKTYRRIEEFFNLNLYDFGVKIGPTKEVN